MSRTEEMILEGQKTAAESYEAARRILEKSEQTKIVGQNTCETLYNQGEQLKRVLDDLDTIEENGIIIERNMNTIESIEGQIKELMRPNVINAVNTTKKVDKKIEKQEKKRQKEYAKQEKKNLKEQKKLEKRNSKINNNSEINNFEINNSGSSIRSKNNSNSFIPKEINVLGDETNKIIIKTDEILDIVSDNVYILKQQAISMRNSLDDQIITIDAINQSSHKNNINTRKLEHKTTRMIN